MRRFLFIVLALSALGALFVVTHNVPTAPTPADISAIAAIAPDLALPSSRPRSFGKQIATIRAIQEAVLKAAPVNDGIPLGEPREPADLLAAKKGLCFDRSRAIEKALSLAGIENRHAFVYAHDGGADALMALFEANVTSHAVTEARTEKGWMLIDSNARWIGLTPDGAPKSLADLAGDSGLAAAAWDAGNAQINTIFRKPFGYMFGLYSRHGRFYPPYTPVPDFDITQIGYNFTD